MGGGRRPSLGSAARRLSGTLDAPASITLGATAQARALASAVGGVFLTADEAVESEEKVARLQEENERLTEELACLRADMEMLASLQGSYDEDGARRRVLASTAAPGATAGATPARSATPEGFVRKTLGGFFSTGRGSPDERPGRSPSPGSFARIFGPLGRSPLAARFGSVKNVVVLDA